MNITGVSVQRVTLPIVLGKKPSRVKSGKSRCLSKSTVSSDVDGFIFCAGIRFRRQDCM